MALAEDSVGRLSVRGSDPDGEEISFQLATQAVHGQVSIDARTGQVVYAPARDYQGPDEAWFYVSDSRGAVSPLQRIEITVTPVNDAPTLIVPVEATNSPYSQDVYVDYDATDIEGSALTVTAASSDETVAQVEVIAQDRRVRIRQVNNGEAQIRIEASDGELGAASTVNYKVLPVSKIDRLQGFRPGEDVIVVENASDAPVTFGLAKDGAKFASSLSDIVEEAKMLPDELQDEPLARKLWRLVRRDTYHWYSISDLSWTHDPLRMLNSVGFGLCDDVASLLVLLAQDAGIPGRVWGLNGHTVSELWDEEGFAVFDADLGVRYRKQDGRRAGVQDLASDPQLITSPINPNLYWLSPLGSIAYSDELANYYATTEDNAITEWHTADVDNLGGVFSLLPGSRLAFPVRVPIDVGTIGGAAAFAPYTAGMSIFMPPGFSGEVHLPLRLVGVRGSGRIRVGTNEWDISSPVLAFTLSSNLNWLEKIEVLNSAGPVELVFLVNPLRFGNVIAPEVSVNGLDVWRLNITRSSDPDRAISPNLAEAAARPL